MCGLLVLFLVQKEPSSSKFRNQKSTNCKSKNLLGKEELRMNLAETNGGKFAKLPSDFHVTEKSLVFSESDHNPDWHAVVVFCNIDPVTPAGFLFLLIRD